MASEGKTIAGIPAAKLHGTGPRTAQVGLDLQDLGTVMDTTGPEMDVTMMTESLEPGELVPEEEDADEPTRMEKPKQVVSVPPLKVPGKKEGREKKAKLQLIPGTMVHKYELVRMLGKGGMGTVWAAHDTKLGRKVAIKFLHAKAKKKKEFRERFLAEARATAQFNHENIVIIHDSGEFEGNSYLVLEYLDGEALSARLLDRIVPSSQAIQMMIPVVRALVEAHSVGIVHRDLKPDNIFLLRTGGIKVLDFGLAKLFETDMPEGTEERGLAGLLARGIDPELIDGTASDPGESRSTSSGTQGMWSSTGKRQLHDSDGELTEVGSIMGTYGFMSPEQWGMDSIDRLSDLWAVGVILFKMVTGDFPFGGKTAKKILPHIAKLDEPVRSARDVLPEVPDDVARVIAKCLQKRKADRIGSAEELLQELENLSAATSGRITLREGQSPYPGLAAFTEKDANRFFGRDAEVAQFIGRLKDWPTLAVVGPSGAGKSSFVRAGVIPTLRSGEGSDWDIVVCRPGRDPFGAVAAGLLDMSGTTTSDVQSIQEVGRELSELTQKLQEEPGTLGHLLRGQARRTGRPVLVYLDQFEELFTLVEDADERDRFATAVASVALDATTPVRVVLSMRSDFLDRVAENQALMGAITRELTILQQPTLDGLRDALVRPAAQAGYSFEDEETVDEMVQSLVSEPAALPLLQFAAQKLWEARDKKSKLITRGAYHQMGGVEGALVRHADSVVQSMSSSDRAAARHLFQRLVTPEGTRAVLSREEIRGLFDGQKVADRLLRILTEARLLTVQTVSEDEADARIEIVHESLIGRWQTLRRWLEEGHEDATMLAQLREASRQWKSRGRPTGLLWTGDAADEAKRWRRRSQAKITSDEEAFLTATFRFAERAQRRRRLLVTAAVVIMALVTVGAVISLVMIQKAERHAKEQAKRAVAEAQRASAEAKRASAAETKVRKQMVELAAETRRAKKAEALAGKRLWEVLESRTKVKRAQSDLEMSYEELKKALKEATKERKRAEKAERRATSALIAAREATAAERRTRKIIERMLAQARKENRRLKRMRVKMIQKLPIKQRQEFLPIMKPRPRGR